MLLDCQTSVNGRRTCDCGTAGQQQGTGVESSSLAVPGSRPGLPAHSGSEMEVIVVRSGLVRTDGDRRGHRVSVPVAKVPRVLAGSQSNTAAVGRSSAERMNDINVGFPTESAYRSYFDELERILSRVREANRDSIPAAARIVAETIARDGLVHIFGSGHSQLLAMEAAERAGGLAAVEVIFDPGLGKAETLEGYAATLLPNYNLRPPDCLIVISNSGRNPSPIEMARAGQRIGLGVIAVTALDFSRSVTSRHSSGLKLYDVVDVILDTCGVPGDAAVFIDGAPARVGPTSTTIGAALLNAMLAEAVAELVRRGIEPPILISQNTDDFAEHNTALRARYRGRVRAAG